MNSLIKRMLIVGFVLILIPLSFSEKNANAASENKPDKLKVGWYIKEIYQDGAIGKQKEGVNYEYYQRISYFENWEYEYCYGDYNGLLEDLQNGKIDVLAGVSKDNKYNHLIYSSQPEYSQDIHIYASPEAEDIEHGDAHSLQGARMGVIKDSYEEKLLKKWIEKNNITCSIEYFDTIDMLNHYLDYNIINAAALIDEQANVHAHPIVKIGTADYYFAMNEYNVERMKKLNDAVARILEAEPRYYELLFDKYSTEKHNRFGDLNAGEKKWLKKHKRIVVGCLKELDHFTVSEDDSEGQKGVLPLIIKGIKEALGNIDCDMIIKEYDSGDELKKAIDSKEIDCVFPVYENMNDFEAPNSSISAAVFRVPIAAFGLGNYDDSKAKKIAVIKDHPESYYAKNRYPDSELVYCKSIEECVDKLLKKEVYSVIACTYYSGQIKRIREDINMTYFTKDAGLSFVLRKDDIELMTIIERGYDYISKQDINGIISNEFAKENKYGIKDAIRDNVWVGILIIAILFLLVVMSISQWYKASKSRKELKKNQERLEKIVELTEAFEAIYEIDIETGMYTMFNKVGGFAEEVHKLQENSDDFFQNIKINVSRFVAQDDQEKLREFFDKENIAKVMGISESIVLDYRYVLGERVEWYRLKAVRARSWDERKVILIGIFNNDKEYRREKKAQLELKEAMEKAEAANKAKTTFLFNMSHDIRTPMNAIKGFTEIAEKYADDKEKVVDCLGKVSLASEQLLNLINEVLDLSRIESGHTNIDEAPTCLSDAKKALDAMVLPLAEKKNIEYIYEEKNIRNKLLYVDMLHVNQIMVNIIGNAVKYTHPGGKIFVTVEQLEDLPDGRAQFFTSVKDNGMGMSKAFVDHVFEQFSREKSTTESGLVGTGLGMSIVKELTERMGGTVDIESVKGAGTTVNLYLPFRKCYEEVDDKVPAYNEKLVEGKRLLIVEDNDMNREIAIETFTEMGFLVDEAKDGDEAVSIVKNHEKCYYDIVFMDIQMLRMDGYEAASAIRKMEGFDDLPIIALSANAFEEDRRKSIEAGMNDHLAKPIELDKLKEIIMKHIKK